MNAEVLDKREAKNGGKTAHRTESFIYTQLLLENYIQHGSFWNWRRVKKKGRG
jgi:hypothetical protein